MSSLLAPGGSIMAIGSPGATRMTTKTTMATPNSVTSIVNRRTRNRCSSMRPYAWMKMRAVWRTARVAIQDRRSGGRGHQRRQQRAGHVLDDIDLLRVHDRLRILHQRQHIGLLGDVFVDRLPAGDALGLVLF